MCFFCNIPKDRIVEKNHYFTIVEDGFPVTEGHTLIISNDHKETFFELSTDEQHKLTDQLNILKQDLISKDSTITGFNIGMNCGISSGQTVMHFHCHLIPRRDSDMENPRGGVRGVIPEKQKY